MLLISLAGFCFFYLIPFLLSFFYSVVDNPVNGKFCGLQNYKALFQNIYFLRGLKNTAWFMAVSIPLNVVLSLCVAFVVRKMKAYSNYFSLFFLIPLAIPSATSAFFWENFFGLHDAEQISVSFPCGEYRLAGGQLWNDGNGHHIHLEKYWI